MMFPQFSDISRIALREDVQVKQSSLARSFVPIFVIESGEVHGGKCEHTVNEDIDIYDVCYIRSPFDDLRSSHMCHKNCFLVPCLPT